MNYDDYVLMAIQHGRRNITEIQKALPLFMRADIRASINRLMWRGWVVRKIGEGYLPANIGCPRRIA